MLQPDYHISKSEKGVAWQGLLQLFQGTSQTRIHVGPWYRSLRVSCLSSHSTAPH